MMIQQKKKKKPIKLKVPKYTTKNVEDPVTDEMLLQMKESKKVESSKSVIQEDEVTTTKAEIPKPKKVAKKEKKGGYLKTEEYKQEATLISYENFIVDNDVEALRKSMKGLGTSEEVIVNILGRRSWEQRIQIVSQYKSMFGRDLLADLKSELSGNLLRVCKALCVTHAVYDATQLRKAMRGVGTDEDILVEIICTRTNAQVLAFTEAYAELFTRDLEKDVESETSGHLKRILVSLLQAKGHDSHEYDEEEAIEDAEALYEAGAKQWGTDESVFIQIIGNRTHAHLREVFRQYNSKYGATMEDAIKSEMSGDVQNAFVTLVRCIENKPLYFAKALTNTMKGLGTDDKGLLRIILTRCEIDMVQIKEEFFGINNQTLEQRIKDETHGRYKDIILLLLGDTSTVSDTTVIMEESKSLIKTDEAAEKHESEEVVETTTTIEETKVETEAKEDIKVEEKVEMEIKEEVKLEENSIDAVASAALNLEVTA